MAKTKNSVNKSEAIRELLKTNPKLPTKEVVSTLAEQKIEVKPSLVYLIKSKMHSKKQRQTKKNVSKVTGNSNDAVAMIRKVRSLADEAGGMQKLKELVDAIEG